MTRMIRFSSLSRDAAVVHMTLALALICAAAINAVCLFQCLVQ